MPTDTLRQQFDRYIGELFPPEDDALLSAQRKAEENGLPSISIQSFEGYLLAWLVRLAGTRKAVEIGTLAGYSAIWIARSLPADGKLYTVEVSSKHAQVAQENFEYAGMSDRVEVVHGDAHQTLAKLSGKGPFDFVFIDADKPSYASYLDWAVANLREGGIVAAHNAFRAGDILKPETEADHQMVAFNKLLIDHPELDSMILPMGDGMAVGVRRSS